MRNFVQEGDTLTLTPTAAVASGVGYLFGIGAWSDRSAAALKPLVSDPHRLVAAAVITPEYVTS